MSAESFARDYKREYDEKRPFSLEIGYLESNPYSVLVSSGKTKVICSATGGLRMPPHLRDVEQGWITAEYSMIPASSKNRIQRERRGAKGRTKEIERLIARSLRSICDLRAIPNESIMIDCDVIQADGGTRTASITGGFIALYLLLKNMQKNNRIRKFPISDFMAAISIGIVHGQVMLDLNGYEDMIAQVDMNIIMTESGKYSEIQATGEESTFSKEQLDQMLDKGNKAVKELINEQKKALGII